MLPDLRLSLRALRAFVAVVEDGAITAAAARLNIAPSAVAAALDQVEAEMGAHLLVRTRSRGIAPTPEARDLAARFRAVLDSYADALASGRDTVQRLQGSLRIGYYAPVAPAFLPALLTPLVQTHPDLDLVLEEHDNDSAQAGLLAGQLDVIVFAGPDARPGITSRSLLDLPPYVLAPADHPICTARPASLAAVARYPMVALDRPLARPYTDALFAGAGLSPRIVARANSTEMVRSLVGAGTGLAILAMRPATDVSYAGDTLRAVPMSSDLPRLNLSCGVAVERPRRAVATFLAALRDWAASPQARALLVT